MNKNYKKDIESFLDFVEGKIANPTYKALSVYRRYEKKLKDISTWPDIFGDLYGGVYICSHGGGYYTIDGVHDCFPKTHYKSVESLYQDHQKGIQLTLRSVYENFYNGRYDEFLEDLPDYNEAEDLDTVVGEFYDVMFKGGPTDNISIESYALCEEYKGKDIYDPEKWPEIFNKIAHDKIEGDFLWHEEDGYHIFDCLGWFSNDECGSFEEVYREILGWEAEVLDFRDVWNKFYRHYLNMREAIMAAYEDY